MNKVLLHDKLSERHGVSLKRNEGAEFNIEFTHQNGWTMRTKLMIFLVFLALSGLAQSKTTDSLKTELAFSRADTNRVNILVSLANYYKFEHPDSAILFGQQGLTLSRKLNYPPGEAGAWFNLAVTYNYLGNTSKALDFQFKSLQVADKNALVSAKQLALTQIGNYYNSIKDSRKALFYLYQALMISDSTNPKRSSSRYLTLANLANTYLMMDKLDSAEYYAELAFGVVEQNHLEWARPNILSTLGMIYDKKGQSPQAMDFFRSATSLNPGSPAALEIARKFRMGHQPDSAIRFAQHYLSYAQKTRSYPSIVEGSKLLAELFESKDAQKANTYNKIAIAYQDSLINFNKSIAFNSITQFDQKERQYEIEAAQASYKNRIRLYGVLAGSGTILLIAFILYWNNRKQKKANHLLQQQKEELEQQSKEAEIQAALERVRSHSIAMHQSKDLLDVTRVLAEQLSMLGIRFDSVSFAKIHKDGSWDLWVSTPDQPYPTEINLPYIDNEILSDLNQAWEKGKNFIASSYNFEVTNIFFKHFFENTAAKSISDARKQYVLHGKGMARSVFLTKNIWLSVNNIEATLYTDNENQILQRFAKVFEQAYTRFLDLQKAEERAREAQIEGALERVRSRSLAMHHTDELKEVVRILFEMLGGLNFELDGGAAIITFPGGSGDAVCWVVSPIEMTASCFRLPYFNHPFTSLTSAFAWVENSGILINNYTGKFYSDEEKTILIRFARVFEQAYIRFLDLQKAEAQAEEARIEASLERVRTAAMAMQNSNDVGNATALLFKELDNLGIVSLRCGIIIIQDTKVMDIWTSGSDTEGKLIQTSGKLDMTLHPLLENVFASWKEKRSFYTYQMIGEEITNYYKALSKSPEYSVRQLDIKTEKLVSNVFFFEEGGVYIFTADPLAPKEIEILGKFTGVFGLTYRRYLDLKLAEEQTRLALKQAAVDRVRAEIASMRTVEDLQRITPSIWRELKNLRVPFFRCGVFIFNEPAAIVQVYLSTPEGKPLAALALPTDESGLTRNAFDYWRRNAVYRDHWDQQGFVNWMDHLRSRGQLTDTRSYQGDDTPPGSLYLHFIPFKQGMLYVGNADPLQEEEMELVQSLAKAFAMAYTRYEDFRQLEQSKTRVEETLRELQETQKQLIQSEKMASLGELTAGIAHEIQNPLNFVNNFSEVNNELLDELKEEATKGNLHEVKTIADDLKGNNQKIVLHGKRADAIVKGMLQHSRSSSGQKEPTDINALADEYLRLAYHGLRAKDKSFNAKFETDFDPSVPKINVVPQDIGRVILNLINNAFYAVSEKKTLRQAQGDSYVPTVSLSTRKLNGRVEMKIHDNGNGISAKLMDKIFQPFFTTKPAGQGTGLGLSLSFDIVKAHGGELKVETMKGESTSFFLQLPIV
ncbi:MAG: hypothetical protein NVS1B13_03060 [Flavisolibacter sp.]